MESVQKATSDLYNECCTQMTKRIKSGEFSAADIKAAVDLIKVSNAEISFDNSEESQNLQAVLNDADSGEEFDPSRPPEYNPEFKIC